MRVFYGDVFSDAPEKCDIAFYAYGGAVSLNEELREPRITKKLALASRSLGALLLVGFVALADERRYSSVLVIDNGRILGISDSLTDDRFSRSKRQRVYVSRLGKAGVIVGRDILSPDSVKNLYCGGADFIAHISDEPLCSGAVTALKGHFFFYPLTIFSAHNDAFLSSTENFHRNPYGCSLYAEAYERAGLPAHEVFPAPSFEY